MAALADRPSVERRHPVMAGLVPAIQPVGSFTTLSGHDYSTDAGVNGVPEPSTWAMLLIGFAGLRFAARYRMARASAD
jgi:PEP-CTERM motif